MQQVSGADRGPATSAGAPAWARAGPAHPARRFPDLAREYYRAAAGRMLGGLAAALGPWPSAGTGRAQPTAGGEALRVPGAGATLDRAMFEGEQSTPSDAELQRTADDIAQAFLAAYAAR